MSDLAWNPEEVQANFRAASVHRLGGLAAQGRPEGQTEGSVYLDACPDARTPAMRGRLPIGRRKGARGNYMEGSEWLATPIPLAAKTLMEKRSPRC